MAQAEVQEQEKLLDSIKKREDALNVIKDYSEKIKNLSEDNVGILDEQVKNSFILVELAKKKWKTEGSSLENMTKIAKAQFENIKNSLTIVDREKMVTDAYNQQLSKIDDIEAKMFGLLGTLKAIVTNPMVLMLTLAVAIGKLFVDWSKAIGEFRRQTGITGDQFDRLNKIAMSVASELALYGIGQKEALEITQELVNEYGSLDMVTENVVKNTAQLSAALGLSASESVKLLTNFQDIAVTTEEGAINLIKGTVALARQSDVAPGVIMRDIADSAEAIAKFSYDGGQNIGEAAIAARLMGINLNTVANIAEKLLDFESSIEGQMQASVLLGRSFNLDRARTLAIQGDLVGMQKALVNEIGDELEFNKLNIIQRKAMSDALGLSVAEIRKMIVRGKELEKITSGAMSPIMAIKEGIPLSEVLDAAGIIDPMTKLGNVATALGFTVAQVLLPAFEMFANVLDMILSPLTFAIDLINGNNRALSNLASKWSKSDIWISIAKGIGIVTLSLLTLKGVMLLFNKFKPGWFGKIFSMKGVAAGKGGFMGSIFGGLTPLKMLGGAAAMLVVAASVWVIAKALQEFKKIDWKEIVKGGVAIVGLIGVMTGLGLLMASPIGLAIAAGVLVFAAMSATLFLFGKAMTVVARGVDLLIPSLKSIAGVASDLMIAAGAIYALSGALIAFGTASVAASAGGLFSKLFGGGIINELKELASLSNELSTVAIAVKTIKTGKEPTNVETAVLGGIAAKAAPKMVIDDTGKKEINLEDVVDEIAAIKKSLKDGVDLKLDGAKIGEFLVKTARH